MALQYFKETKHKGEDASTEWGSEAIEAMCMAVRDFPIPNGPAGSTLGTLIDLTPTDLISKVTLEEKCSRHGFQGEESSWEMVSNDKQLQFWRGFL